MVKAKQVVLLAICVTWLADIYGDASVQEQGVETGMAQSALNTAAPNDPLFNDQWHLKNTGEFSGSRKGEDLNVTGAWAMGYTGQGINIVVVDDGVEYKHEDLAVDQANSKDFSGKNPGGIDAKETGKPKSDRDGAHGTAVAGLAAAKGNNKTGVTGVAYAAKTISFNNSVKSDDISTNLSAIAGISQPQFAHVSNNSWGPADDGQVHDEVAKNVWRISMDRAVTEGRDKKGVVSVWAAGNGGYNFLATYQGYNNDHNTLTIAALNDKGIRSSYSSPGVNVLVSAFGGEACKTKNGNLTQRATTTTDIMATLGYNSENEDPDEYDSTGSSLNYTRCMDGTSAATPQVSGVVALMLEANSKLGWRDVRRILATTARKNDADDSRKGRLEAETWRKNAGGYWINDSYGFGAVDAAKAVKTAKNYTGYLGKQITVKGQRSGLGIGIPDGTADTTDKPKKDKAVFNTTEASAAYGESVADTIVIGNSGIDELEYVELKVGIKHNDIGELKITLTSPGGTTSTVARRHPCYYSLDVKDANGVEWKKGDKMKSCGGVNSNYIFGIVQFMDEKADGAWVIEVADGEKDTIGTLDSWNLTLYGHEKIQAQGN